MLYLAGVILAALLFPTKLNADDIYRVDSNGKERLETQNVLIIFRGPEKSGGSATDIILFSDLGSTDFTGESVMHCHDDCRSVLSSPEERAELIEQWKQNVIVGKITDLAGRKVKVYSLGHRTRISGDRFLVGGTSMKSGKIQLKTEEGTRWINFRHVFGIVVRNGQLEVDLKDDTTLKGSIVPHAGFSGDTQETFAGYLDPQDPRTGFFRSFEISVKQTKQILFE